MAQDPWKPRSEIPSFFHYLALLAIVTLGVFFGSVLHDAYIEYRMRLAMADAVDQVSKLMDDVKPVISKPLTPPALSIPPAYPIPAAPAKSNRIISGRFVGCAFNPKTGICQCFDSKGNVLTFVSKQACEQHAAQAGD